MPSALNPTGVPSPTHTALPSHHSFGDVGISQAASASRSSPESDEEAEEDVPLFRHTNIEGARLQEHFRKLRAARRPVPPLHGPDKSGGSATLSHLTTPFVDARLNQRRSLAHGVRQRFLTPTPPAPAPTGAPPAPRREISEGQAAQYQDIGNNVIAKEKELSGSHNAFYHAQDPRMRVAQDVYKRVYQRHHQTNVPDDFHFLRFPGPEDTEFSKYPNVQSFFEDDMQKHGMIDDNITPTKSHIISANLSAFGGLGHAGEETFHYFQIGKGQTQLDVPGFMSGYLQKFGLDPSGAADLFNQAQQLNDTKEGSLFQIMVPRESVDQVAYLAHPHGLPHDDELLDDLHTIGPIKYNRPLNPQDGDPKMSREKLNDEVTRNLKAIRDNWTGPEPVDLPPPGPSDGTDANPIAPGQMTKGEVEKAREALKPQTEVRQQARLRRQAEALNQRTVERFRAGQYSPIQSGQLDRYIHDPSSLRHPELEAERVRMESNPEHFGGQGVRSHHETMRVQNRSNFMQARVLLSDRHMLNPASGIQMIRHTTADPRNLDAYNKLLDDYVEGLFKQRDAAKTNT